MSNVKYVKSTLTQTTTKYAKAINQQIKDAKKTFSIVQNAIKPNVLNAFRLLLFSKTHVNVRSPNTSQQHRLALDVKTLVKLVKGRRLTVHHVQMDTSCIKNRIIVSVYQ